MRSASLSMMLKTNLVYLFSVPASQSLWWTETKQKKSNKFKDEFKIFHKLCSSQVKENLQYSQDFVASTILLHLIIIPVNSQKNSQQTISYPNTTSQPRVFINTQFSTTIAIPSPVHYTTTINQNYYIFWSLTGTNFFQFTTTTVLSYFPISSRFYKNSDRSGKFQ